MVEKTLSELESRGSLTDPCCLIQETGFDLMLPFRPDLGQSLELLAAHVDGGKDVRKTYGKDAMLAGEGGHG